MHVRVLLAVSLAAGLAAPAFAQPSSGGPVGAPDIYVCTADASILRVSAGKLELVTSGTGTYDDCVVGPDGLVYISNGTQIVRVNPASTAKKPPAPQVVQSGLPSAARGLAFNGNVLYINTASSGVWTLTGTVLAQAFPAHSGEGRGLAFEIDGTLAAAYSTATGGTIQRAPYKYETPAGYQAQKPSDLGPASPRGIAVNTCGDVVYADAAGGALGRLLKSTHEPGDPVVSSTGAVPVNLEIDSSNRHYLLLADNDTGRNPRVVRADPVVTGTNGQAWITTCDAFATTELAGLKGKNAVGLAIGPSAHRLTWDGSGTEHVFDFGYHQAAYRFSVPPARLITVTAYRTPPAFVRFSSAFPAGAHALPFSPLGGQAVQLVLEAASSPTLAPLGLVAGSYSYYTQEPLGQVGIGRAVDHYIGPTDGLKGIYLEDVQHDLWELGDFDAKSGEAENDFSKRVIYNAPAGCQVIAFSEPFDTQNPLFNGPQTIPITVQLSGTGCNAATVRLSVARLVDATNAAIETQNIRSNVQTDNIFDALGGGRYRYVLDASSLNTSGAAATSPAKFLLTVWGDVAPANRTFEVTK